MMSDRMHPVSRRSFLGGAIRTTLAAGAGIGVPAIVPGRALGQEGLAQASERIRVGIIGCGSLGRGGHHLGRLLRTPDVEVTALCDVDSNHRGEALSTTHKAYGNEQCKAYPDFRELLDRKDLDAVVIVTPDHWHAIPAILACQAGKDVYCEKPLSLTIQEGRAMVEAARKYNRVFQTGSQQRSDRRFRLACQCVRNGRIGELKTIEARIGGGPVGPEEPASEPPPHLDWNFWLGPTPWVPYQKSRCHYTFRWIYDYSGGKMTDWGAHHNDIAQWAMGADDSGPVSFEGRGTFPDRGIFDTAVRFEVNATYANGVVLRTVSDGENGVLFTGSKGWIFVSRGRIEASEEAILADPFSDRDVNLEESADHHRNWLDCIKSRKRPICDVEVGHRSATVCHLENIAIRCGRKITWDPKSERIVGDTEAARYVARPMRAPWKLG